MDVANHIAEARSNATAGGGTFSSSFFTVAVLGIEVGRANGSVELAAEIF